MANLKVDTTPGPAEEPLVIRHLGGVDVVSGPYLEGGMLFDPIPARVVDSDSYLIGNMRFATVELGPVPPPAERDWTPDDLGSSLKTNGGWWGADNQVVAGGSVSAWVDKWGVRNLVQAVGAAQPVAGTVGGHACANFLSATAGLFPDAAFTPKFWAVVAQYKTGSETTFSAFARLLCDYSATDNTTPQVFGSSSLNSLNTAGGNAYASTCLLYTSPSPRD